MQAIYYYPTKLSITSGGVEHDYLEDFYNNSKWQLKSKQLQARRWERVHAMEQSEKETKQKRLKAVRQKRWLRRHGWPRISQPMT